MPDHHGGKFILCDALHRDSVDVMSAADDRAHVGGRLDLLELVCDDDDGLPILNEVLHNCEKLVDLLLRQHCGGLVQDQDLSSAVQRFEDLDTLLHSDCNILYQRIRIDFQPILFDNVQDILPGLFHVQRDALSRFRTQNDILRYSEILDHARSRRSDS